MTYYLHPPRTLPDGTRVYANGTRYKPIPTSERKYLRHKPDDPDAKYYAGHWVLPLDVMPEEWRPPMPETRPDEDAYWHMAKPRKCRCDVCRRPEAKPWKLKWKREHRH